MRCGLYQKGLQLNIRKIKCFLRPAHMIVLPTKSYSIQVNNLVSISGDIMHQYFSVTVIKGQTLLTHCVSLMQFRCCGVTNHTDWFEVYNASRVPDSCCLEYSDNCGLDNPGTWWTAVSSAIKTNMCFKKTLPITNFNHFIQDCIYLCLLNTFPSSIRSH